MDKNLLRELTTRIKTIKKENVENVADETQFINFLIKQHMCKNGYERYLITPQQYNVVLGVYQLLRKHPQLSEQELTEILRKKYKDCHFIRLLNSTIPNLADKLYYMGPSRVIIQYLKFKIKQDRIRAGIEKPSIPRFICDV